jgi:tyrosyl-DNA phosphodiesterase 2
LRARRRRVPVGIFDVHTKQWASQRWTNDDALSAVPRDELTVATFNVWFSDFRAEARYRAIADLMSRKMPDVMVFQEVTPAALAVFLAQPWVRVRYRRAEVTGGDRGNYGMLLLSRLPIRDVTYTRLPTNLARGFLTAELDTGDSALTVVAAHLESGKAAARLRARQLGRIFGSLRRVENAVVLGDFNMRDSENDRITKAYRDLWPTLRPRDDGFTEDTSINLMRLDSKNKQRQVRFDRVLLKGDGWAATSIDLLGTEPISDALPRVFPSDHFGVLCRLERLAPTKDARHQRLWPPWRR